jgi:hypothetical protein
MRRKSWKGFHKMAWFLQVYSRWQKFITTRGDYFEENVAEMIVLLCVSHMPSDSRNILEATVYVNAC